MIMHVENRYVLARGFSASLIEEGFFLHQKGKRSRLIMKHSLMENDLGKNPQLLLLHVPFSPPSLRRLPASCIPVLRKGGINLRDPLPKRQP
jgi:hypothetical protein